jgi:hypothetical protein
MMVIADGDNDSRNCFVFPFLWPAMNIWCSITPVKPDNHRLPWGYVDNPIKFQLPAFL